jgi:hypothetical protein
VNADPFVIMPWFYVGSLFLLAILSLALVAKLFCYLCGLLLALVASVEFVLLIYGCWVRNNGLSN